MTLNVVFLKRNALYNGIIGPWETQRHRSLVTINIIIEDPLIASFRPNRTRADYSYVSVSSRFTKSQSVESSQMPRPTRVPFFLVGNVMSVNQEQKRAG